MPAELVIDGMSVFSALSMDTVKAPSENSMSGHLWWLSDQLRTKQIQDLIWCDTRDMRADPMTKGSIGRELILDVMGGNFKYEHEIARLSEVKAKKNMPSSQHSSLNKATDIADSDKYGGENPVVDKGRRSVRCREHAEESVKERYSEM